MKRRLVAFCYKILFALDFFLDAKYNMPMLKDLSNEGATIRFTSLEIENFSCVKKGSVSMDGGNLISSDILGVYGQNGSGKSALVNAFAFLRLLLCGAGIEEISDYVRAGEDSASFKASFVILAGRRKKIFEYYVKVIQNQKESGGWYVSEEKAVVSDYDSPKNRMTFEYSAFDSPSFVKPASLAGEFIRHIGKNPGLSDDTTPDLFFPLQRELSRHYKTSYLFHPKMLSLYGAFGSSSEDETLADYMLLMNGYALRYLFVMNDSYLQGPMQKDEKVPVVLPNQIFSSPGRMGYFAINLNGPTFARETESDDFLTFIGQINFFLKALCPDTELFARKLDNIESSRPDGTFYQVFTKKDGLEIPIKFESLGIKKLISLVNVLVLVYINPCVLIIVDEFDSSLHECVLHNFLKAFKEGGKGQLLFTSNNLYPMELLEKSQCCFTTVNAENRYVKLKYVRPNNNLRSLYLSEACGNKKDGKNPDLFNPISSERIKDVFSSPFLGHRGKM